MNPKLSFSPLTLNPKHIVTLPRLHLVHTALDGQVQEVPGSPTKPGDLKSTPPKPLSQHPKPHLPLDVSQKLPFCLSRA